MKRQLLLGLVLMSGVACLQAGFFDPLTRPTSAKLYKNLTIDKAAVVIDKLEDYATDMAEVHKEDRQLDCAKAADEVARTAKKTNKALKLLMEKQDRYKNIIMKERENYAFMDQNVDLIKGK